ncbi:hypothetical protein SSX86_027660 [Deinandra increscens subsp. villosa]|uniref:glucan endo-1,3-beta-D-glucosidase n=1 Tax=Deinandra increscens subsp. villosa TaxID=3103831 RepID=A0AAP0CBM9_9ASTR
MERDFMGLNFKEEAIEADLLKSSAVEWSLSYGPEAPNIRQLEEENQQNINLSKAAQLTIFYKGTVNVFDDMSPEKAQSIMLFAGNIAGAQAQTHAATPKTTVVGEHINTTLLSSSSLGPSGTRDAPNVMSSLRRVMQSDVPQMREASLVRFLEKRRERISNKPGSSTPAKKDDAFVGVNIGTSVTDMPNPTQVVALLKAQQIRHVRLYDADAAMLTALAGSGIRVTVSVPNQQLLAIGQSNATAANWVARNILIHVPATNITAISVGSEVLTAIPNAAPVLVSALKFIHAALIAARLDSRIKVSTAHSSSIILDSFPPSQAFFNRTWDPVMVPLLDFLRSTGSYLMLNVYPYYDYSRSHNAIPLDYALFRPLPPNKEAVDSNTLLHYTNVFDAVVDAAYFAMSYLNFTNIPIVVTESGWPSKGGPDEPDTTPDNANTYNSNLIKHVLNNTGTPKHPGVAVSTFIYELYNEDSRTTGAVSEKNWGLFDVNGEPVYVLKLTGSGTMLANDTANQTYCVAKDGVDRKTLQAALDWACGPGKVDCSGMGQGAACYEPDTVVAHATYAFDAYYHGMAMAEGTCDFKGVATVTTTDPSHGDCIFPGSNGSKGTFMNNTILAPSLNSTSSGISLGFHINSSSIYVMRIVTVLLLSAVFL